MQLEGSTCQCEGRLLRDARDFPRGRGRGARGRGADVSERPLQLHEFLEALVRIAVGRFSLACAPDEFLF